MMSDMKNPKSGSRLVRDGKMIMMAVAVVPPSRCIAMRFFSTATIMSFIICVLAMSVESTFVIAPFSTLPTTTTDYLRTHLNQRSRRRRRHHHNVKEDGSTDHNDELPLISKDENRRKLILVAPSALSLLLLNSDGSSAAASTTADVTADITVSPTDFVEQQINTAIVSTTSPQIQSTTNVISSSRGVLCADTEETSRIAIFERVAPSVVYIDTFSEKRDVFSTNVLEVPVGSGSGFIWDTNGHIVTNFHVIQEAKSAQVAILTSGGGGASSIVKPAYTSVRPGALGIDGSTVLPNYTRIVYKAKVVGVDPTKDIAVLKVDDVPVRELRPIELGTSTGLRVGQGSLAIGNPFGLDHTLTTGVISGIGREVKSPSGRPISNVIQTDAAINPGNSGGPLLDSSGKMIGMATAIYSPSGASAGVGFAIPVDTVKYVVDMLIKNGEIIRPLLGVSILDSRQARQALGITKGILILEVKPGTPASKAGLRGLRRTDSGIIEIGDIITAVEDKPIENEGDLFRAIETFEPGDVVKVTVNRPEIDAGQDGSPELKLRELTFSVTLIASDNSTFLKRSN